MYEIKYEPKNFDRLFGTPGFSDTLLKNHFTLYQGYVANTNKLIEELKKTEPGIPQFAELKRRFGWEWNGMRLHELYFGNMTEEFRVGNEIHGALEKRIIQDFGSIHEWRKDFTLTGAMRGIGWAMLALDTEKKIVFNTWVNEHDTGHLAGAVPLLVMDVFEHAYILDYGLKRADYIEAFMKSIDWSVVEARCK